MKLILRCGFARNTIEIYKTSANKLIITDGETFDITKPFYTRDNVFITTGFDLTLSDNPVWKQHQSTILDACDNHYKGIK